MPEMQESADLKAKLYRLFRDYFDMAEKKRRWNIREDIPWDQVNKNLDPAVADVVWTFCAVELFLPDYLSKMLPQMRDNRGRAWMFANWGYEESKHSMTLGDWLLRSGWRSDEQMADMEAGLFKYEWNVPFENKLAMVSYTPIQELATGLHYRNLRRVCEGKCPALDKALGLISVDESAHADFFRKVLALYLEEDRAATLEQMRLAVNSFDMPAVHMLFDGRQRIQRVRELNIFNEQIYLEQVLTPFLQRLGVSRYELRKHNRREKAAVRMDPKDIP